MKKTWSALLGLLLLGAPAAPAQFRFTTNAGTITITGYSGPGGAVIIPSSTNGFPVATIGNYAFYDSSLTSVTIPGSVTSIGQSAFLFCTSLGSVTIPGSVASIGNYAFDSCASLTNATINDGVASIGEGAFADSTSLASVTIPGSVASMGESAWNGCTSLTNVTINYGVAAIGDEAFQDCLRLAGVTIPGSVTNIGEAAFQDCFRLASVSIPASVTSIGESAFSDCSSLASVTIPGSVASIGNAAFSQCSSLASVYFMGNAPAAGSTVFTTGSGNGYDNATVYYMPGATGWSDSFAGLPAVLWNPLIQTGDGNLGVRNNQFGFDITGTANIPIVVEACANLASPVWTPLQSLTLTNGLFYFSEPVQANSAGRFYRISSP
jgi:hypothetical protein